MGKIAFQALLIVTLFFATWLGLSQIDWLQLFEVEEKTDTLEEKLGNLFWEMIDKTEKEITQEDIYDPVDSLLSAICTANYIDRDKIKLHIVRKSEINAFALPGNHMVVYTGLIMEADNQGEVVGVIGHELGHLELNHVMKKLVKEVGLTALIGMTSGGGGELAAELLRTLSSKAYDRNLEKEADIQSVDYLLEANINPEDFANFLYKLGSDQPDFVRHLTWISTHPESKERAEYIIEYTTDNLPEDVNFESVLSDQSWDSLKSSISSINQYSLD